jgi:hypothetical protein
VVTLSRKVCKNVLNYDTLTTSTVRSTLTGLPYRPDKETDNGKSIWMKNVLNGWTDNGQKDNCLAYKG